MYELKSILKFKKEVQNCKIALENGQLMDCINFIKDSEWYNDNDKDYVAMAIIDDIDKKRENFPTAINFFDQDLEYFANKIKELLDFS